MPLFSIITITKGNPEGLARTKASVVAQTYKDFEWIVIDGDKEPDQGIYDAMNKGCDRAHGEYLIFMNGGDVFAAPDVLDQVAPYLSDRPDFVYGDAFEGGHYKPARHDITRGMMTHHQAMFYRASPRRYDMRYKIAADYKYTAEAVRDAKVKRHVPVAICVFEEGGVSQRRVKLARDEQTAIRREMGIDVPFLDIFQLAASTLKRFSPGIYWALRSRLSTPKA